MCLYLFHSMFYGTGVRSGPICVDNTSHISMRIAGVGVKDCRLDASSDEEFRT